MDFIVDAMLPIALSEFLKTSGHNSIHTLELPSQNSTTDSFLNNLSINESKILITKDSDFEDSLRINSKPYKLVLVTTGNISNMTLINIFRDNLTEIVNTLTKSTFIEISDKGMIINF